MLIGSNWIINNLTKSLNTWNESLTDIINLITSSPEEFKNGSVWAIIEKINGGLQAVGLALLVLFFVVGILKTCTSLNEVKKPEHAFKYFIRFVLAKAIVTYGMELMLAIFKIGQGICNRVIEAASVEYILEGLPIGAELPEEIVTAILNCGFLESIPLWAVTIIGSLFITIMTYIMIMTIYGRFFKLYIYADLAPIPLSCFSGESTQHIGISFFKSFCGVCLESAVIVLACVIFTYFASSPPALADGDAINMVWSYVGELAFNMLVLVGTIKMSDRVIKEMMGI